MIRWLINDFKRCYANAARANRLKDAAPELLDALRWLLAACEEPRWPEHLDHAIARARTAIAKAQAA